MTQYLQDYDEKYPMCSTSPANIAAGTGWVQAVDPYTKSAQIYQCPSEPTAPNSNPASAGYSDYWYNLLFTKWNGAATEGGVNASSLANSANTYLSADGDQGPGGNANDTQSNQGGGTATAHYTLKDNGSWDWGYTCTGSNLGNCRGDRGTGGIRHFDGANYLFADGHVKWLRADKVFATKGDTPSGSNVTFRLS